MPVTASGEFPPRETQGGQTITVYAAMQRIIVEERSPSFPLECNVSKESQTREHSSLIRAEVDVVVVVVSGPSCGSSA